MEIASQTKMLWRVATRSSRILAAVLAVATMFCMRAYSQSSAADILGTVSDSSGATVANATVTLVNTDTNDRRTFQTDKSGAFDFPSLNPGHYSLTIEAQGFSTVKGNQIVVAAGDRRRVDTALSIGSVTQTLEVTGSSPALQTDSSALASTITELLENTYLGATFSGRYLRRTRLFRTDDLAP